MAAQLDIYGGESPNGPSRVPAGGDPGLQARLGRRDANRSRIAGDGASWARNFGSGIADDGELIDPHTTHVNHYGLQDVHLEVFNNTTENKVPYGPHDAPVFRKAGVQREVPLHGPDRLTTMQDLVSPDRVAEIQRDPSSGSDPRFPGREIPLSVQMKIRHPETGKRVVSDVLWNGNHRVAAAIDRGELFTPVQSITRSRRAEASEVFHRDAKRFSEAREQKVDLSGSRMAARDPFLRQGFGDDLWENVNHDDD